MQIITDKDRDTLWGDHTFREDFEHFLSYSGLRGEASPEMVRLMELAAWAMWSATD